MSLEELPENDPAPADPQSESLVLSAVEARVLGCLLEKERTTPEYYPLSGNALTNACNQKSNRKPILLLEENEVREAADGLREKGLALMFHGADARVPKFKHTLGNVFELEQAECALLCELLLRGPQTVGELRGRCQRLYAFSGADAVEEALRSLMEYPLHPLVARLPRQPGQKEQRYAHLLSGPPPEEEVAQPVQPPAIRIDRERLDRLERELAELRAETANLRADLDRFRSQFE